MLKYIKLSLLSMVMVGAALHAEDMVLSSDSFNSNEAIPQKYAAVDAGGENLSPALKWGNPPSGTTYYALAMQDADAKNAAGAPMTHWILTNIPTTIVELPEGVDVSTLDGVVVGTNDLGNKNYDGPNPGDQAVHHYTFTVYALDSKLDVANGVNATDLQVTIAAHVLGNVSLVGTYSRS